MPQRPLREWQNKALIEYEEKQRPRDFLVVATPASGKTQFAIELARRLLDAGTVVRIVVIVPTVRLCDQWRAAFSLAGMELEIYDNQVRPESTQYRGMVCTYAQINPYWAQHHRSFCGRRTLVIFDELHHAGEDRAWGEGISLAFDPATKRLGLSGTPWRRDNNKIPFVEYTREGLSQADFRYTYADALRDRVCRPVYFPIYNGTMEWWSGRGGQQAADWTAVLNRLDASRRLRTGLTPGDHNPWFRLLLENAHHQLLDLRHEQQPEAGGLIFTRNIEHAAAVATEMKRITGTNPVVVHSEDKYADKAIDDFTKSTTPWIVAVKMISEGVDIPRLRVGVYATDVADSELFFRQAVGRFLRWQDHLEDDQPAFFYLPADQRLIDFAHTMKEERDHQLDVETERQEREQQGDEDWQPDFFVPGGTSNPHRTGVINDGETFADAELRPIEEWCRQRDTSTRHAPIILRWKHEHGGGVPNDSSPTASPGGSPGGPTLQERTLQVSRLVERQARSFAYLTGLEPKEVHILLCIATDTRKADRTLTQHERCLTWLVQWKQVVNDGITRSLDEWKEVARRARESAA